jgi:mannose-6-phosphate isomerase-like protein (cupin superfamily)
MASDSDGITTGDGFAVGSLDDLGDGPGFRKVRRELDVKELGVNALVFPPGIGGNFHYHERQEELYFVHSGEIEIEFGDGSKHTLGPGGLARVDAPTHRRLMNTGSEDAVILIVGAEGGYVGRDGQVPEGEDTRVRTLDS